MPLDRLVLIIACVIIAAMGTIYIALALLASVQASPMLGLGVLSLVALSLYILWRVIAQRVGNKEEDHYDNIEH